MFIAGKQKIKEAIFTDGAKKPSMVMLGVVVNNEFRIRLLADLEKIDKNNVCFDFSVINGGWDGCYNAATEKVVRINTRKESIDYQLLLASNKMIRHYNDTIDICESVLNNKQERIDYYLSLHDDESRQKINDFVAELREAIADAAVAEDVAGLAT